LRWPRRRKTNGEPDARYRVWILRAVVERTLDVLRASGTVEEAHEGIVYWAGRRLGPEAIVTTCIVPMATTTFGSFRTSSETNAKVVMYLATAGLELLGQVHSHPGKSCDHSEGDDELALMPYEGFVSIVVPHYARCGMEPLSRCGIHVFETRGFRRLTPQEIRRSVRIVDGFTDLRPA